ncbi:hypothetical protein KAJ27_08695 [bacterium]|nr:hypothetical protein [bacterium]
MQNNQEPNDLVIENEEMKLVISPDGTAKSLLHKPTNKECLMQNTKLSVFSILLDLNYSPYNDLLKANLKTMGEHEFNVDSVYMDNNKLIARFELIGVEAVINLDIKPQYIRFTIEDFIFHKYNSYRDKYAPEINELWFLKLPVRERTHFGNWLNVIWDKQVAINILGGDIHARIDSEKRDGYRILKAGSASKVKSKGVSACLIVTETKNLLDNIASVEEDLGLPHGVKNRRCRQSNLSSYFAMHVNPGNVDRHISYALQGGFRSFFIYYNSFSRSPGHFKWRDEYPNGMADLRAVVKKVEKAGLTPGIHVHYNKAGKGDLYVTPVPDERLNIRRYFTLSETLSKDDITVFVAESPYGATLNDGMRILKIGNELVSYTSYTTTQPYKFTGCSRGVLKTTPSSHLKNYNLGLLDIDSWPSFVLLNQNTSIQREVAERLAEIYQKAGFKFIYFDGAEDVPPPYWYNCSKAQWEVYKRLNPEPMFAGGAMLSHFSWHMLSRGNHFDSHLWPPEDMKNQIRNHLGVEAPLMANSFTSTSFGRYANFAPGEKNTTGLQPDMLEYLTSKAAAWDSPWVIKATLDAFDAHPRTSDNLEVVKRWEDAKEQGWLNEGQKKMLKDWGQEYILMVDEQQEFELLPYVQIKNVAGGSKEVRAFTFEREDGLYVVYWHTTGNKKQLELPVSKDDILLLEELGHQVQINSGSDGTVLLPVGNRRYIKTNKLSKGELVTSFQDARIID